MNWLYKFFVRKRVFDFVQNYVDCPANWKLVTNTSNRLENHKHHLIIELSPDRRSIHNFNAGIGYMSDNLRYFERRYLLSKFRNIANSERPIPTKATHPEEFI